MLATRDVWICLVRTLRNQQDARPNEIFFSCDGESVNYRELWNRAGTVAGALRREGIAPGHIVAALAHNSVDMLCLMFGCLRAGAVWAPLNIVLGPEDLTYSVEAAQANIFVVSGEMIEIHADIVAQISRERPVVQLDDRGDHYRRLTNLAKTTPTEEDPEHHWDPSEFCWIIYSGATTGRPKPIKLPHSYGIASARRTIDAIELQGSDICYSVLQMCHGWLLFHIITMSLLGGNHCATTRWFSASRWLSDVKKLGATVVDPFLPMINAIMAQPEMPDDANISARVCIGGLGSTAEGAADKHERFEKRFGLRTLNFYGTTEIGGLVARETLHDARRRGSIGQPHPSYEIRIADENGWPVPADVAGEILVRPLHPGTIALGYLGNSEGTLETWRDLWVHTSDIGYLDADSYLFFQGRHAHWIRRKSETVSIKEVEDSLLGIDGVREAGVIGVPSDMGDEESAVFLVLESEAVTLEAIHQQLVAKLAYFKVPRFYERVSTLPKTVKGEVSRRDLKARGLSAECWDAGPAVNPMKRSTALQS